MKVFDRVACEQGAVLIHVAIVSLVLMGFATFAIDSGVLWVARHQAQNAADSGAIAGAIARAYDDFDDPPMEADQIAEAVAEASRVWSNAQLHEASVSFACPGLPADERCVRVDVYRNGLFGSSKLPMFFAPILNIDDGIPNYGVQATATAHIAAGNTTDCLRPLAIPDKWTEQRPPADVFEKYDLAGKELFPADAYTAPTIAGPGTGYKAPAGGKAGDYGFDVILTFGTTAVGEPISPGRFLPVDLGGDYADNITGCSGQSVRLPQVLRLSPAGSTEASTAAALQALVDQDPDAEWNAAERAIQESCVMSNPSCGRVSPRVIAVAVFDPDEYQLNRATGWPSCDAGISCVRIVNIVGLFIRNEGGVFKGNITNYPGTISGVPSLSSASSFLPHIRLIR